MVPYHPVHFLSFLGLDVLVRWLDKNQTYFPNDGLVVIVLFGEPGNGCGMPPFRSPVDG